MPHPIPARPSRRWRRWPRRQGCEPIIRHVDRSHALRGNTSRDALRRLPEAERGASLAAFPRGA
ncbi:hypothetical protein C1C98_29960 [Pseudomonas ogarae]|uniref:DUF1534 domain-containing protein n=1 Tax=Pseudomonas ogarae (strain DSM 112162 / CECT 30235 / F113) TaxID=1114970 RepID=A0ABN5GFP7_PSEO1|nr:hypothetical protein C1C98_29960 [Pseudomonas ogarae]